MVSTVAELLREATRRCALFSDTPRLDAEILLAHLLRRERAVLLLHPEMPVAEDIASNLFILSDRRAKGEPVAYLTGFRAFYEDEFSVDPRVLVPRPETEHLVEEAVRELRGLPAATRILDLCTGSGCVGLSLARYFAGEIVLADLSPEALAVARRNAERLFPQQKERIRLIESDLFDAFSQEEPFDLITVNPPYLSGNDMTAVPGTPLAYEPAMALFGGGDGFDIPRRILTDAPRYLRPGGILCMELGIAGAVEAIKEYRDLTLLRIVPDLAGIERVALWRRN